MRILVTGINPDSKITHNNMEYPLGSIIEDISELEAKTYINARLAMNADKMTEAEIEKFRNGVIKNHEIRKR